MYKLLILLVLIALWACSGEKPEAAEEMTPAPTEEALLMAKSDPVGVYGTAPDDGELVDFVRIVSESENYENKEVVIKGLVADVCAKRGCWIDLENPNGITIRYKVNDGEIVFPKSAVGHPVVAKGVVERMELEGEKALAYLKHVAEEEGVEFDESSAAESLIIWRVKGASAEISPPTDL